MTKSKNNAEDCKLKKGDSLFSVYDPNWIEEMIYTTEKANLSVLAKKGKAFIVLAADTEQDTRYLKITGDKELVADLLLDTAQREPGFRNAMIAAITATNPKEAVIEETPSETKTPKEQEEIPEWQKAATDFYKKAKKELGDGSSNKGYLLVAADMPNKKSSRIVGGDARTIAYLLMDVMMENEALLDRVEAAIQTAKLTKLFGGN